jgi:hypothetical protein
MEKEDNININATRRASSDSSLGSDDAPKQ